MRRHWMAAPSGGIGENDGTSALRIWLEADAGTGTATDGA